MFNLESFDILRSFSLESNINTFMEIFGQNLGVHLYSKFQSTGCNLFLFVGALDYETKRTFIYWLNAYAVGDKEIN